MKRIHTMPFGAHCSADGRTTFRLWAPSAESAELQLEGPSATPRRIKLEHREGWYETAVDGLSAGDHYRYWIDDDLAVPDPASRFNPDGVHHSSVVIDPCTFEWYDDAWQGRPWSEAVIYELHVGTFTREGTYAAIIPRLSQLVQIGITALELLPLASFPGSRGWGYDGVLPYAPHAEYGTPDDLKALVQAAHSCGLMVLLDVVYNHFGPEGNYLARYAQPFFTDRYHTPWGKAINFDGELSREVREFFIHNALYWIEEYHLDGLRLDAVHAMYDQSGTHFVDELARRVHEGPGRERPVHLILENHENQARRLQRSSDGKVALSTAQWNDDIHHALHVLLTGERDGYYVDFADEPERQLGRALAEGFIFQGEPSRHEQGRRRGESSTDLPLTAFVSFLQNHDQIGNRAFGERLGAMCAPEALRAGLSLLLLAPQIPMLFMGEEYAAPQPFLYFCEYGGDLAAAITEGRRNEFSGFAAFKDEQARARIPDPNAPSTRDQSQLDWNDRTRSPHAEIQALVTELLEVRQRVIVPLLDALLIGKARYYVPASRCLAVVWPVDNEPALSLEANLSNHALTFAPPSPLELVTERIYSSTGSTAQLRTTLAPWEVRWLRTTDSAGS
jgi:maltooligosyltrehalose trehalohydrolase